jgi:peptidoglycan hydrolase-like protein with peptidoglycan-binding domain
VPPTTIAVSARRDLSDPRHVSASLEASRIRRSLVAIRRGRQRAGRRGVVLAVLGATLVSSGALAQSAGQSTPAVRAGADSFTAAVQAKLGISADGIYGPVTRAAVRRFQRAHGLSVDGIVGPQTQRALGISPAAAAAQASQVAMTSSPPVADSGTLAAIAQCESNGNPTAISPNGTYRGKYQFTRASWRAVGGVGDPAAAPESEQDQRAATLMAKQGPDAWPVCSRRIA